MARIIIEAVHAEGEPRRWTLSERIVPDDLHSPHYATQLLERLSWAVADAQALEAQASDITAEDDSGSAGSAGAAEHPAGRAPISI
jgi:hypothetical protein